MACSAVTGRGIADIWNGVLQHHSLTRGNGWFEQNRREQRRRWMHEILEHGLRRFFSAYPLIRMRMETFEREVLEGQTTPFRAARVLLDLYANLGSGRSL
jgi:LAO/AO transport system kinase